METLLFIIAGLVLLGVFMTLARLFVPGGAETVERTARVFILVWFLLAIGYVGISLLGDRLTWHQSMPVLMMVWGIPAFVAANLRKIYERFWPGR